MQRDRRVSAPVADAPPGLDRLDLPIARAVPEVTRGAATLRRLGIYTPRQALFYLPFRYDDFSDLRPLGDLVADEKQSARVRVTDVKVESGFGRRPQRVIAQLADDTGSAEAIWFGRRFVERRLEAGDELVLSGKVAMRGWRPQFVSPDFSPAGTSSIHTGRIVPVYPLVGGVTQRRLPELPMRRLLQGDVGSGKTAVAAVALAAVSRAGWQGALMAPTEVLARQHYLGLAPLLEALGVRGEFLSGSLSPARKRAIHDAIES